MKIRIKKYRKSDFDGFDNCMVQLQDFLVNIDPIKRLRKALNFSPLYAKNVIEKVAKYNGLIFLAYDGKKIIGCIAGIIEEQSKKNLFECMPTIAGRILELFVKETYRSKNIGKMLMKKMENHMIKKNCDVIRVEVFEPNSAAYSFYKKLNYRERVVDMIKIINISEKL